jgi:hypothetical protein
MRQKPIDTPGISGYKLGLASQTAASHGGLF